MKKKHSRSSTISNEVIFSKPGVFPVFSPDSLSYRRLIWYTTAELNERKKKMLKHLETIQNPILRKKIRYELKTIKSILS